MPFKTAVIGVGKFGQNHARIYSEMPDVDLIGVVDADGEQARSVAQQFKTRAFSDYHEVMAKVDGVSIVTPTRTHHEVAKDFLSQGIPVLVEKPITETVDQAKELVKLSQKNHIPLQVGHIERFNPVIMAINSFNITPMFIEAHRLHPYSFRAQDVGVVLDLMIHDIDVILHLVKSKLRKVDASGFGIIGEREDMANARLTFKSGCVANVTASRIALKRMRKIRVFSTHSYISLDYEGRKGYIYKLKPDFSVDALQSKVGEIRSLADLKDLDFSDLVTIRDIRMDDHNPLEKELESFIDCARNGHQPVVSGEHGLRALEAATQVIKAIHSHDLRKVKRPAPLLSPDLIENNGNNKQ